MKTAIISISIPQNLLNQLNKICQVQERTKSYLVKKALEKYIKETSELNENSFTSISHQTFAEEWQGKEDEKAFTNLQKYLKTK